MRLIDTHCHLTHGWLAGDLAGVLERASQAGVIACICASGELDEASRSKALAEREIDEMCATPNRSLVGGAAPPSTRRLGVAHNVDPGNPLATAQPCAARQSAIPNPQLFFTAGVHPHDAKNAAGDYLGSIEDFTLSARCVAIGEIGLDYHYDFSPRDAQRRVFAEQLGLARHLGKCVVIHTREAFDDTLAIIRETGAEGRRIVFHSFTEAAPASVKAALDLGAMISFSGIVTFARSQDLQRTARIVPADRILIETDSPYLSPEPVRKMKTNEPANVAHVAACVAAIRGTTVEEFAELTTANAARFFGLPT